jgi:hypothetical protein
LERIAVLPFGLGFDSREDTFATFWKKVFGDQPTHPSFGSATKATILVPF